MLKTALFDPYQGKFTAPMVEWLERHGHEVQRQPYYNPELVDWADVIYFFTCDNNLLSATNPTQALKMSMNIRIKKANGTYTTRT